MNWHSKEFFWRGFLRGAKMAWHCTAQTWEELTEFCLFLLASNIGLEKLLLSLSLSGRFHCTALVWSSN